MGQLLQQIQESANYLKERLPGTPKIGIVLGTGLGGLADKIKDPVKIPYGDIPHFPTSTVVSHKGNLVYGTLHGTGILLLQGRFHFYEGYSMQKITFPIRVFKALGGKYLLLSNAAGGMNPLYKRGDLMVIEDQINLMGDNPLIGPNEDELGPRFPDMSEPYSKDLMDLAIDIGLNNNIYLHKGVLVGVAGPNLETRAEYRFLRTIGADMVGMSTIPEVLVAVHSNLKVLAISIVTDECFPDCLEPVSVEKIIAAAEEAEPKLSTIFMGVIEELSSKQ